MAERLFLIRATELYIGNWYKPGAKSTIGPNESESRS